MDFGQLFVLGVAIYGAASWTRECVKEKTEEIRKEIEKVSEKLDDLCTKIDESKPEEPNFYSE